MRELAPAFPDLGQEPPAPVSIRGKCRGATAQIDAIEDEARFGTQGTITRVWARKGSQPRAVRQNGREWLHMRIAVCVGTGAASARIVPEWNTAVLNLFLE